MSPAERRRSKKRRAPRARATRSPAGPMFNCFTPRRVVVGVDVGTGSARAGVFDASYGARLATASAAIRTWTYGEGDFVEQSGDDIWRAVCLSVREAVSKAGCPAEAVVGLGFDATCSLVVVDGAGAAVSVADEPVVAGDDPEMEMPKIAWLKKHKPECVAPGCRLFDLADYLSWRASGDGTRSTCTVVCKWNWHRKKHWDDSFLAVCGLADLRRSCDIGGAFAAPGAAVLAASGEPPERTVAIIAGTSCCIMATSREAVCAGRLGPYAGAMVPGTWLSEGGQSAAGMLLDHVVASHAGRPVDCPPGEVYDLLNSRLDALARERGVAVFELARHVHVDPDFRGNRAPLADLSRAGSVVGLKLDPTLDNLAVVYLATVLALAYQTRHVLEVLEASGHAPCAAAVVTGGMARNALYVRALADALDVPVSLPEEAEAVLLGAAALAATAANAHPTLLAAMAAMTRAADVVAPDPKLRTFHDAKYDVFRRLSDAQADFKRQMADA
ncbi:glycerol kinase [Aureococcus anophagefferens]|nr:glycerol kinase [Aureococcus anophagefferens]